MAYKIGIPVLKLNDCGKKSKHTGSFKSVAEEALEERKGRDKDINHEISHLNRIDGFKSAAELRAYSDKHIKELSEKQKAEGKRGVRSDAVKMCVIVFKPPMAYLKKLTPEQQEQLLEDGNQILNELIGADRVKSTAFHYDEQNIHFHKFFEPCLDDGRLCAKEFINADFYKRINQELAPRLRARGWDVADCDCYDKAEEKLLTEEERAERRSRTGKSSVAFKAEAEARKNELVEEIEKLEVKAEAAKEKVQVYADAVELIDGAVPPRKKMLKGYFLKENEYAEYKTLKADAAIYESGLKVFNDTVEGRALARARAERDYVLKELEDVKAQLASAVQIRDQYKRKALILETDLSNSKKTYRDKVNEVNLILDKISPSARAEYTKELNNFLKAKDRGRAR